MIDFLGKPVQFYKYRTAQIKNTILEIELSEKDEKLFWNKISKVFGNMRDNHIVVKFETPFEPYHTYYVQYDDGVYSIALDIKESRW